MQKVFLIVLITICICISTVFPGKPVYPKIPNPNDSFSTHKFPPGTDVSKLTVTKCIERRQHCQTGNKCCEGLTCTGSALCENDPDYMAQFVEQAHQINKNREKMTAQRANNKGRDPQEVREEQREREEIRKASKSKYI